MLYASNMTQQATYWAPSTSHDEFSTPVLGSGELIACRWQDVAEVFRDAERREFISNAVVYVASPVLRRGYLALGDHTGTNPADTEEAFEVRQVIVSPSLDGSVELHKVVL